MANPRLQQIIERARLLCEWIAETPHQRGSINGLAAQVKHECEEVARSMQDSDAEGCDELDKEARKRFRAALKEANEVRAKAFPNCTDPCSRHAAMIAEYVGNRKPYSMLRDEPENCAESILVTVRELWATRLELARMKGKAPPPPVSRD